MATTKMSRPAKGGAAATRPSAVNLACESAVLRELALGPFALPAKRWQVKQWAEVGMTAAMVRDAVDRLALAGLVKVKPDGCRLTAMRATSPASTVATTPVLASDGEDRA